MILILVDEDLSELDSFSEEAKKLPEINDIREFKSGTEALGYARERRPSIAVIGQHIGEMDSIEMGSTLRQIYPEIVLVYICQEQGYAGAVVAGCQPDLILMQEHLPGKEKCLLYGAMMLANRQMPDVYIMTFGRFDVFVNGRTVLFRNKKAKELFALCIDHKGGGVQMEEAVDKLWPDKPYDERTKRLYRKAVASIHETLQQYDIPQLFVSEYGKCYVFTNHIQCDYYDFLKNGSLSQAYNGQYMFEYEWAEETTSWLDRKVRGGGYGLIDEDD